MNKPVQPVIYFNHSKVRMELYNSLPPILLHVQCLTDNQRLELASLRGISLDFDGSPVSTLLTDAKIPFYVPDHPQLSKGLAVVDRKLWRNYFSQYRTIGYLPGRQTGKTEHIAKTLMLDHKTLAIVSNQHERKHMAKLVKDEEIAARILTANEVRKKVEEDTSPYDFLREDGARIYVDNASVVMHNYWRPVYDFAATFENPTLTVILIG